MAGINGALDAFFNIKNSLGVAAGWSPRVHMSKFQLDTPAELQELQSRGRDDYNQVIGAINNPQPATFSFTLRGAELEMFRLTWLASISALTQTSGAVVDEVVNIKGTRFKVSSRAISAAVVTSSPSGTTYVAGTDYVLTNARLGLFDVVPGSALATAVTAAGAAGLNILVDYTKAAVTGIQMLGGAQPTIITAVMGDGINRVNLKPFDVDIPQAIIAPDGGLDLLAQGFTEASFTARMVTVAPYTSPFVVNWPEGI